MTGDEIYLYDDAGYEPSDTACYTFIDRLLLKKVKRSHEIDSDIALIS